MLSSQSSTTETFILPSNNMERAPRVTDFEFRLDEKTSEINLEMLHPENPLMIRFQKALKQQLENKLEQIQNAILQSEGEIKKLQSETDTLSEILYVQKSEVKKMEKMLYEYNEKVSNSIEMRERLRNELDELKKKQSEGMTIFQHKNKFNTEFRHKVDIQRHILTELQNYDRQRVSNLFVKRNSILKNKNDKETKLREKDEQDYLLMRLENEIFKFELLIQDYEGQLNTKCEERIALRKKLATKNSEFADLSDENSRLLKLWKTVVLVVSNRDEKCSQLKIEFEKHEICHKTKIAELNSYKRDANEEIFRNETIIASRNQKQRILGHLKIQHCDFLQTERRIDDELTEIAEMTDGTRKTMNLSLEEYTLHKQSLSVIEVRLKNLNSKKIELEERILSQLHNELLSSNISTKLNSEIRKLQNTTKQQEMIVEELHTNLTNKMAYLEKQKVLLNSDYELLRNLRVEIDALNETISDEEERLNKLKLLNKQENYTLELERKRLHDLEKQPVQDSDLPEKLNILEENLKEINKLIESEKRIWIRKQNEAMQLTERKSTLAVELNGLRSHIYILQQKSLCLNQNMVKEEKEHHRLDRTISQVLRRISYLNNEYSIQKESEGLMDDKTCTIQNMVLEKLKAAETDSMQLVSEIQKLDEKKELLGEELLNCERENLEWQKKFHLGQDMKESIMKEQSENGDIGAMKNEIHRMEIRYAQLKRAQESLVCDLEKSVHKRDRVMNAVITKESTLKDDTHFDKSQRLMTQKVQIIKTKIRTMQEKIAECENEKTVLNADRSRFTADIEERQASMDKIQETIEKLENQMFEYFSLKQKNLEILIRKQRLAEFLYHVKTNKVKFTPPTDLALEKAYAKQRYLQNDLNEVLETLRKDFPDLSRHILKIVNVLNSLPDASGSI